MLSENKSKKRPILLRFFSGSPCSMGAPLSLPLPTNNYIKQVRSIYIYQNSFPLPHIDSPQPCHLSQTEPVHPIHRYPPPWPWPVPVYHVEHLDSIFTSVPLVSDAVTPRLSPDLGVVIGSQCRCQFRIKINKSWSDPVCVWGKYSVSWLS